MVVHPYPRSIQVYGNRKDSSPRSFSAAFDDGRKLGTTKPQHAELGYYYIVGLHKSKNRKTNQDGFLYLWSMQAGRCVYRGIQIHCASNRVSRIRPFRLYVRQPEKWRQQSGETRYSRSTESIVTTSPGYPPSTSAVVLWVTCP